MEMKAQAQADLKTAAPKAGLKFNFPGCKKVPGKSRTEANPWLLDVFLIPSLQLPGQQK